MSDCRGNVSLIVQQLCVLSYGCSVFQIPQQFCLHRSCVTILFTLEFYKDRTKVVLMHPSILYVIYAYTCLSRIQDTEPILSVGTKPGFGSFHRPR